MVQETGRLIQMIESEEGLSIVWWRKMRALRLCHFAFVLDNRRIGLRGRGPELARSESVKRAYLGI
jgi:branched-chain amino acid transport system ATP-binding protein